MTEKIEAQLKQLTDEFYNTTGSFYEFKRSYLKVKYKGKRSKRLSVESRKYAYGLYILFNEFDSFESFLNIYDCTDKELDLFFKRQKVWNQAELDNFLI